MSRVLIKSPSPAGPLDASIAASRSARESENLYRAVFDHTEFGMIVCDLDGTVLEGNEAMGRILGYRTRQLAGRQCTCLSCGENVPKFLRIFERVASGETEHFQTEKRFRRRDGSDFWGSLNLSLVRGEHGEPRYVLAMVEDLTERRRSQATLRASEERLRLVLEATTHGFWDWNLLEDTVYWSDGMFRSLGLEPGSVTPALAEYEKRVHADDREGLRQGLRDLRGAGLPLRVEFRVKTASMGTRWYLGTAKALIDENGRPYRAIGSHKDITDCMIAEEALRDSEAMRSSLIESSIDYIMMLDLDAHILFINRSIPGLRVEQKVGESIYDSVDEKYRRQMQACYRCVIETGGSNHYQVDYRTRSGKVRSFESRVAPVFRDGRVVAVTVNSSDITEYKRAAAELQSAHDELETRVKLRTASLAEVNRQLIAESNERRLAEDALRRHERLASIGTLAAGIAHEINNPVGGIMMAAQYGLTHAMRKPENEVVLRALRDIESDARRCGQIVESILHFARHGTSELRLHNLNDIVESAIALARISRADRSCEVQFVPVQKLPSIQLDKVEMEQAVANIIRNAMESRDEGVQVVIRIHVEDAALQLTIEDNGNGIPGEHLERIFDPFYTTRRGRGGTGLGLTLAHAIVVDHGGSITPTSTPGKGTTFHVRLPLVGPAGEETEHAGSRSRR